MIETSDFDRKLRELQDRVLNLGQSGTRGADESSRTLRALRDEIAVSLEEVRVAGEELGAARRRTEDALQASRKELERRVAELVATNDRLVSEIAERARAEDALTAQNARLGLISRAAGALLSAADPDEVVRDLFRAISERFDLDVYLHFMVTEEGDALRLDSSAGISEEEAERLARLEFGQALCGTAVQTRQPIHATHVQESDDPKVQLLQARGVRCWVSHPLLVGEQVLGALSFASCRKDLFGEEELEFFQTVSHNVALARERLRTEAALRLSQEAARRQAVELETILDAVPAAVWVCPDARCGVVTGSRVSYDLLRLPYGSDASLTVHAPKHPARFRVLRNGKELAPEDLPIQVAARLGVEVRDVDEDLVFDDGTVRHLFGNAAPLFDAEGKPRGAVAAFLDITDRVRMETELVEAKAAAEAANRAKSDFLARMSHEIRTPMNGVVGMTELALMEPLPPKPREYLGFVKQSARALLDIINDILDLAKIEAGKAELKEEEFDLRVDFAALLSTFDALASRKGLAVRHSVAAEVPRLVRGDRGRLGQVLANLVGNAIKFTEIGSVAVAVEVAEKGGPLPAGRVRLLFAVRDTGIGIPSDRLGIIFEAFSQAGESSHHTRYGGTGLGLTISRQLVELMGGTIWAESPGFTPYGGTRSGPGSTFRFTVELGVPEALAAAGEGTVVGAHERLRPGPIRILLAEDNAVNQLLGKELLEREGHTVVVAENGREALDALGRGTFDLVLMDVQMPELDGAEAARLIRGGLVPGAARDVPIVALTAHALRGDRERFLAAGMDDYLSKPIDLDEVYRVLAEVSARRAEGREA
jgi:signal transduction histidine kinase/CheY-like chemotaxis protein